MYKRVGVLLAGGAGSRHWAGPLKPYATRSPWDGACGASASAKLLLSLRVDELVLAAAGRWACPLLASSAELHRDEGRGPLLAVLSAARSATEAVAVATDVEWWPSVPQLPRGGAVLVAANGSLLPLYAGSPSAAAVAVSSGLPARLSLLARATAPLSILHCSERSCWLWSVDWESPSLHLEAARAASRGRCGEAAELLLEASRLLGERGAGWLAVHAARDAEAIRGACRG